MKLTRRGVLIAILVALAAGAWPILWGIDQLYREPENYSLIEDGLWMGGNTERPPPGTRAVLNLCELDDPYRCEVHAWKSIRDAAPAPSIDWLKEQVDFIEAQRDAGRTTFVHCFQGASRSGLVVTDAQARLDARRSACESARETTRSAAEPGVYGVVG